MLARLAETRAAHEHRADPEFTVDEMIERDTGRRDVAAGVGSGELDPKPFPLGVPHAAQERLDGLHLDQRDFAPAVARLFRVEPGPGEIPIASLSSSGARRVFCEQFEVAKKIVALHVKGVLPRLEPWVRYEDMRRRGNAAFVFARLGDDRGVQVIRAILEDRSSKRAVFEIDSAGHPSPARQIRADRYYAAHLFGDLKDLRAVPILVPLLKDEDVKEAVPWSLGEIGDKSALTEALGDNSLTMRASALLALEKLRS